MQYEFQFDLQQETALNAAISLWKKEEVKNEVTEFFESSDELNETEAREEWKELVYQIVEESDQNMLCPKLKGEWIHIVNNLGEKIYNWYLHIEVNRDFPFGMEGELKDYIDEILWTSYGTVDEVKIFESYLSKNTELNLIKMYSIACSYALEEHINDLWNKMSDDMKDYCESEIEEHHDGHTLAYWKYRRDNNLSELISYFSKVQLIREQETDEYNFQYNTNYSPEENMFWVSVYEGHNIAVKYFWNKLTEEQRNKSVRDCARVAAVRHDYYIDKHHSAKYHKKEKYIEICVYLMNQMSADQRKLFFKTASMVDDDYDRIDLEKDIKDKLMRMLLSAWPWQEFLIPVFKDMMELITNEQEMYSFCLQAIATKMFQDHRLGYAVEHSKYQNMFKAFWCFMSGSIKQKIICRRLCLMLTHLLEVWDLDNLKLIFNDPEISDVRGQYIEAGKRGFLKLILNDKYDLLDQLMNEIFKSEEEKKSFKKQINIWFDSPPDKQYYTAEKLFNHRRNYPDYGITLEGGITDIELCEYFMKWKRYDSINKFLNWKFETKEEQRKYKNHFKNDKFIIEHLCEIWKSNEKNLNKAYENSRQFLHLLLESEEEVARFKKENIVNADEGKLLVNYFVQNNFIQVMENFLFGCSSPKEEVLQVKQKIGLTMGHYICHYNISLGHTEKAESFVRWAFTEKELMHSFIKEFVLSDDGFKSCDGLLERIHTPELYKPCLQLNERLQKLSEFVNFWLKSLENIEEFRTKFVSQVPQSDDEMRKENYKMFMDLMAKLK